MADRPVSCILGFVAPDGSIDMRPSSVFARHLQGWMIRNYMFVPCMCANVRLGGGGPGAGRRNAKPERVHKVNYCER